MSQAYYNENDPKTAAWLRELIKGGHIADGIVDERSIEDVQPGDLTGYSQCHFFAGIGGWSYALRLAGWPDDQPVWTGSCPCQPFSCAGRGRATEDPRHLWPQFLRLIAECRPARIFGEQVASAAGRVWLAGVRADLEDLGCRVGAADLCAAGVGAPHIRQRLYWVADADGKRRTGLAVLLRAEKAERGSQEVPKTAGSGATVGLADAGRERQRGELQSREQAGSGRCESQGNGATGGLADVQREGLEGHAGNGNHRNEPGRNGTDEARPVAAGRQPWHSAEWLPCRDGKARRVEPGAFPLAHGIPGRVGLLRGYGNAIVPQVAAEFIQASEEALNDLPR